MRNTLTNEDIEYRNNINKINSLRSEIKNKKRTLAKLANIPEAVDEYQTVKKEIKNLEAQLP